MQSKSPRRHGDAEICLHGSPRIALFDAREKSMRTIFQTSDHQIFLRVSVPPW